MGRLLVPVRTLDHEDCGKMEVLSMDDVHVLFVDSRRCSLANTVRMVFQSTLPQVLVHVASDRETALRLATELKPRVVLVTGRSAETPTGSEIIGEIRSCHRPTREILISGGVSFHAAALAKLNEVQRVHVLAAPFGVNDLEHLVREVIETPTS